MSKERTVLTAPSGTSMKPSSVGLDKLIIGDYSNWLVKVDLATGKVEFGPDYTPDEAARLFWEAIARNCPYRRSKKGGSQDEYYG